MGRSKRRRVSRLLAVPLELIVPGAGNYLLGYRGRACTILALTLGGMGLWIGFTLAGSLVGFWSAIVAALAIRLLGVVACVRSTNLRRPSWLEYGVIVAAVVAAAFAGGNLVLSHCLEAFHVPSNSMYPSLSSGDHVMVSKRARNPTRGALVAFRAGRDKGTVLLKRIVGLPGQTIRFVGDDVIVNGARLAHTRLGTRCRSSVGHCELVEETLGDISYTLAITDTQLGLHSEMVTIPAGHVFVLSDNRAQGVDSRLMGPIPIDDIVGTLLFRYLSDPPG
ncbi:MAG TPA: signal peptidase I [Polyangiaceae bacterium]|jgi:signal peptidase I